MASQYFGVHSGVRWDPAVENYFKACFGNHRLAAISAALSRPSLSPTLRVNTLRARSQDAMKRMQEEIWKQQQHPQQPQQLRRQQQQQPQHLQQLQQLQWQQQKQHHRQRADEEIFNEMAGEEEVKGLLRTDADTDMGGPPAADSDVAAAASMPVPSQPPQVQLHSQLPAVLVLLGTGPRGDVGCELAGLPEVVINRFAGEAVLKGAHVYAPGVLAASAGIAAGDMVTVSAALERPVGLHCAEDKELQAGPTTHDGTVFAAAADAAAAAAAAVAAVAADLPLRRAIGISRGATVAPDGSVSLSWTRQALRSGRVRGSKRRGLKEPSGKCPGPGVRAWQMQQPQPQPQPQPPLQPQQELQLQRQLQPPLQPQQQRQQDWSGCEERSCPPKETASTAVQGGGQSAKPLRDVNCNDGGCSKLGGRSGGGGSGPLEAVACQAECVGNEVVSKTESSGSSSCTYSCDPRSIAPRSTSDDSDGDGDGSSISCSGDLSANSSCSSSGRASSSGSVSSSSSGSSQRSDRIFLGVGRAVMGRRAMFRVQEGLVLRMERRLYDVPSCNGLLRGEVMLQALPSIVAAQVLSPRPGSLVLDMCAAPGGKTTLLGEMMGDKGTLVALDRTAAKVAEIMSLVNDLGVSCVEVYKADAVKAVQGGERVQGTAGVPAVATAAAEATTMGDVGADARFGSKTVVAAAEPAATTVAAMGSTVLSSAVRPPPPPLPLQLLPPSRRLVGPPPYPPGTFDYILLDPPCSALGLRPRLLHSWNLKQLRAMAAYQRSLLYTAVQLLAPGGEMVYCTCTINPDENEANVAWALDKFAGSLELLPAEPLLGLPGLTGADPSSGDRWLSELEAAMVQRFDPGILLPGRQMAPAPSPSPLSQPLPPVEKLGVKMTAVTMLMAAAATETAADGADGASDGRSGGEGGSDASSWNVGQEGYHQGSDSHSPPPPLRTPLMPQLEQHISSGPDGGEPVIGDDVMGFFIARFRKTATL